MKLSKESIIIGVIALVFIVAIVILVAKGSSFVQPPAALVKDQSVLVRPGSHMTGTSTAKVTMVEFGDYQCPACGAYYPLIKQITEAYKSNPNFNFVFRNFPLPQHAYAPISAEAADAAGAQGKYWEMHDKLYEGQDIWANSKDPLSVFDTYATALGLDVNRFNQDVNAKAYQNAIDADLADVSTLGLDHTPTVFINGKEQTDLHVAAMQATIDAALAE